jgi:hypothetical protein
MRRNLVWTHGDADEARLKLVIDIKTSASHIRDITSAFLSARRRFLSLTMSWFFSHQPPRALRGGSDRADDHASPRDSPQHAQRSVAARGHPAA